MVVYAIHKYLYFPNYKNTVSALINELNRNNTGKARGKTQSTGGNALDMLSSESMIFVFNALNPIFPISKITPCCLSFQPK